MRLRRSREVIAGVVGPTGTITASRGEFTVVRNNLGSYAVTLPADFRLLAATANAGGTASAIGTVVSGYTPTSFNVLCYTSAAAGADSGFSFTAVGGA